MFCFVSLYSADISLPKFCCRKVEIVIRGDKRCSHVDSFCSGVTGLKEKKKKIGKDRDKKIGFVTCNLHADVIARILSVDIHQPKL